MEFINYLILLDLKINPGASYLIIPAKPAGIITRPSDALSDPRIGGGHNARRNSHIRCVCKKRTPRFFDIPRLIGPSLVEDSGLSEFNSEMLLCHNDNYTTIKRSSEEERFEIKNFFQFSRL